MLEHFDLLAPVYERFIKPPNPDSYSQVLDFPVEGMVLDAGGGTGRVSAEFRPQTNGVVICDLSMPMLQKAQTKGTVSPVNAKTERLPFKDATFERVLVVDALHHFLHPKQAISEFMRVLKPGGRLVIEDFDISKIAVKAIALAERLFLMKSRFFTPADIQQMIRSTGHASDVTKRDNRSFWIIARK